VIQPPRRRRSTGSKRGILCPHAEEPWHSSALRSSWAERGLYLGPDGGPAPAIPLPPNADLVALLVCAKMGPCRRTRDHRLPPRTLSRPRERSANKGDSSVWHGLLSTEHSGREMAQVVGARAPSELQVHDRDWSGSPIGRQQASSQSPIQRTGSSRRQRGTDRSQSERPRANPPVCCAFPAGNCGQDTRLQEGHCNGTARR